MRNTPPGTPRRVRTAHESKSASVRAAAAAPSRRQQSRWQREQHQQRLLFLAIDKTIGLRQTAEAEREGLDINEHGERAYNF